MKSQREEIKTAIKIIKNARDDHSASVETTKGKSANAGWVSKEFARVSSFAIFSLELNLQQDERIQQLEARLEALEKPKHKTLDKNSTNAPKR